MEATVTSVDDLVCLCPTCHRIAHTRRDRPLSLDEVKLALQLLS
jgi:predicted HNH restriction endonuclease